MADISQDAHRRQTWTLTALVAASARMLSHTELDHESFAATAESLYWACAADEGYLDLLGSKYKVARDTDQAGALLNGIRWARNRITHQRALVVEKHYGTELGTWVLGAGVLGTRDHLKWVTSLGIPPGTNDKGRDIYDARLAGRPVEDAVEACRMWLFGPTLNQLSIGAGLAIGDLPGLPGFDIEDEDH